ncbi:MAG: DUF5688 family protein [Lachnospiraceae bacterium]|nr:DUF5688 family protein [Lachnospiraceae bacterium]
MNIKEYSEKMKKAVQNYYGEKVTVILNEVTKNNGIILQGISIRETDRNISPTIYLNRFYEEYEEGETFAGCVRELVRIYEENKADTDINMDFFTDYEAVKKRLAYKLINYEKNEELLKEIPHIKYLDLAIVFYCLVANELIGNATVLIRHNHCRIWNVTVEELYENAKVNTPRLLPYEIQNMEDVMHTILLDNLRKEYAAAGIEEMNADTQEADQEWMEHMVDQMIREAVGENQVPMYVLSNQGRVLGAACILYHNVMKELSERMKKDFYVLPSSIHELILIPVQERDERLDLNEMVQEVNLTQVDAEEVLANHAYYYSRITGKLSVVCQ